MTAGPEDVRVCDVRAGLGANALDEGKQAVGVDLDVALDLGSYGPCQIAVATLRQPVVLGRSAIAPARRVHRRILF